MTLTHYILDQAPPAPTPIPGVAHATWAGSHDGLSTLSVWRQSLAPGGATPPHAHDCEEIVLCLAGRGEVHIDGVTYPFGPQQTVLLPAGVQHQIFNVGTGPLETTAVFSATPVAVTLPDGTLLDVPWSS